jgi:hypothetical protein
MVLGAARRMGGCGDALFTALVLPAAVFSSPNLFPLLLLPCCCCVHFCITYQIAPLSSVIHRNAVACSSHWPISIRSWGEQQGGDELRKP